MAYKKNEESFLPSIEQLISANNSVLIDWCIQSHSSRFFFIKSLNELKDILNRSSSMDLIIVYKKKQLPVRGILGVDFKDQVLSAYGNKNHDFIICTYSFYPEYLQLYGHGENRNELNQRLHELLTDFGNENLNLCFGIDPEPEIRDTSVNEDDEYIIISGAASSQSP